MVSSTSSRTRSRTSGPSRRATRPDRRPGDPGAAVRIRLNREQESRTKEEEAMMLKTLRLTSLALAGILTAFAADAAEYPVSSIRLLVPANPGGSTDANARLDRKSVGSGKSVSVRVNLEGRRIINTKKRNIK